MDGAVTALSRAERDAGVTFGRDCCTGVTLAVP